MFSATSFALSSGRSDFFDVNTYWQARDFFNIFLEFSDTSTTTTDHDTSFCGVDSNSDKVGTALDSILAIVGREANFFSTRSRILDVFRQPLGKNLFCQRTNVNSKFLVGLGGGS